MPSSKLPGMDLSVEDDWTKVKDPKEKKRIQNRVAQRTYRHRMKARLGELQARLDTHEGRRPSLASSNLSAGSASQTLPTPDTREASLPPMANPNMPDHPMQHVFIHSLSHDAEDGPPSPISGGKSMVAQLPLGIQTASIYDQPVDDYDQSVDDYDQPVDDSDPSLFPQTAVDRLVTSPPHSQPSLQAHGLLSPPSHLGPDQGAKVSQDFMLDCLRFQTQLLDRLNNLQAEAASTATFSQTENVHAMLDQMSQAEQVNTLTAFTPANTDAMDLTFEPPSEVWKTEPYAPRGRVASAPDALNYHAALSGGPGAASAGPQVMNAAPVAPRIAPVSSNATLDLRFERIMQQAHAAGFESFDDVVTAYYGGTFSEASPLANEQRLSRNRRLPKVVADVGRAADMWTAWERRGFHEEMLKRAESMVMAESAGSSNQIMSLLTPLVDAQDGTINTAPSQDAMVGMKRAVQNELPNTWALTMALAADNRTAWQWDRSNTALATTILLKFSGRIPNDQLLSLVGSCLG